MHLISCTKISLFQFTKENVRWNEAAVTRMLNCASLTQSAKFQKFVVKQNVIIDVSLSLQVLKYLVCCFLFKLSCSEFCIADYDHWLSWVIADTSKREYNFCLSNSFIKRRGNATSGEMPGSTQMMWTQNRYTAFQQTLRRWNAPWRHSASWHCAPLKHSIGAARAALRRADI